MKAIDRIKKLLRLGRDSAATSAEAAAAMTKAIELAAEHGVDLAAIPDDDGDGSSLTHVTERSDAGYPHQLAADIVRRHFGVRPLFDATGEKRVIHFIGLPENCDLAAYCYVYLVRSMRRAWRERSNRRLKNRESFLRGFAWAIHSLMPEVFHRPGLILSADAYLQREFSEPGIKITNSRLPKSKIAESAFFSGLQAGRQAGIRNAIRGTDNPTLPSS